MKQFFIGMVVGIVIMSAGGFSGIGRGLDYTAVKAKQAIAWSYDKVRSSI